MYDLETLKELNRKVVEEGIPEVQLVKADINVSLPRPKRETEETRD